MNKLIGQSYSIEVTPAGIVSKVIGVREAQTAVKGSSTAAKTARALLGADVVKQRHGIPALPAPGKNKVTKGDNWSSAKTFNFGMMGSKAYERVYKLKEIQDSDKGKVAVAEMNAIPSVKDPADVQKEQSTGFLSKLFDNTEEYTGRLSMDLAAGKVQKYSEKLKSEWLAVDPESTQKDDQDPAALRMKAVRLYDIEKLD